jgi:hypothetical protein
MMGQHKSEPQLFNYAVNLEKQVRANHPLREVKALIDFGFVREEVAPCYGRNGNESVPPEVILRGAEQGSHLGGGEGVASIGRVAQSCVSSGSREREAV